MKNPKEFSLIKLNVNCAPHQVGADPTRSLLDYLRKDLGLTGAKNGCDQKGICGACTVIVNGKAVKSCQLKLNQLDNAEIITIEGLSNGDTLHPLQKAFISEGAIQCGFCTSGMIMAAKALLEQNPLPSSIDIKRALKGSLCRCGTYPKVIRAIQKAATSISSGSEKKEKKYFSNNYIGAPLPVKGALEKVTGRLKFVDDLLEEDMLFGKIVWSRYAHAKIKKVNLVKAKGISGVVAVLTAADVPGENAFGAIKADQPVLAQDKVRYLGDPIALVIGENKYAAELGCKMVEVEYNQLQPIYNPEDALIEKAPKLFPKGNLAVKCTLKCGDVERGIRESDVVVKGTFTTPAIEHAYLEPEAGIGEWKDGRVIIRAGNQHPQSIQRQIAHIIKLPEKDIRIVSHPTGGAFGGKTGISIQALLALGAFMTHRRVKIVLTREESLKASVKRHPMRYHCQIGFDKDGHIKFVKGDILVNCGAYQAFSIPVVEQATNFSTGPYIVPHVHVTALGVFTNTPPSSAFRGFGVPQPTFAIESLMDEAAKKLGISPLEIRRLNALKSGDRTPSGQLLGPDTHLLETLEAIKIDYLSARKINKVKSNFGVGIACGWKNVGLGHGENDYANAEIEILPEGRIMLRVGAIDLGQGSSTILAQIAAHELEISYELIDVEMGDTDLDPDARETNASRQTVMSGNAVLETIKQLLNTAKKQGQLYCPKLQGDIHLKEGCFFNAKGHCIDMFVLAKRLFVDGKRLLARGKYVAPETFPIGSSLGNRNYFAYGFFSNLAIVSLDSDSGRVKVEKIISAYDVGQVINQSTLEGQLEGGAIMGMGYALSEEYRSYGPKKTENLGQCGVPRFTTIPSIIELRLINPGDSLGPYGAKGVGEMAMIAVAPSITNAIYDAIGIQIKDLPTNPKRLREVWRNLNENTNS